MSTPIRVAATTIMQPELAPVVVTESAFAPVDTVVRVSSFEAAAKPQPGSFADQAWVKQLLEFNTPEFFGSSPEKNQWFKIDDRTRALLASKPELLRQIQLMMDFANSVMASDLYENEKKDFLERFFSDPTFVDGMHAPWYLGDKDKDDDQNASIAGRIIAAAMSYDHKFLVTLAWGTEGQNGHGVAYGDIGILAPDGEPQKVGPISDRAVREAYMKFANAANKWKTDNGITRPENDPKYDALYKKYLGSDDAAAQSPEEDPAVTEFYKKLRSGQRL